MKVLQLVKTSEGADWALIQMQDLVAHGNEVHVVMPSGGKHTQQYIDSGIIIHDLPFSLRSFFKTGKALRSIVKDVEPDIIHSHFYVTTLFMRLFLRNVRIPRVFQLPGPSHLYYWITRKLEVVLAQKNDFWAGACRFSCDCYKRMGIPEDRIFLSYYYDRNDKRSISPLPDSRKLRTEFGIGDDMYMVGMISYMYKPKKYMLQSRGVKGHEDFIDAIAKASKINPKIVGLCVGGPWNGADSYEAALKKYAADRTDSIIFCGTRKNVPEIYAELACAVQPSHQENLGGAAQALTYECPVVSTNVGGLPDIVIDGVTGYTVNPGCPEELCNAILRTVDDLDAARKMAKEGKARYIALLEENRDSVWKMYNSILNRQ